MSTEESVGLLSNTYISFPRVSFENECVSDTYAWHVTKKAPWHMSVYGAVYVGIVQAVLNSTVSLKHKRYRHVSSRWRRNVRVRRASYKVRVRCNIVRPNTAVQRGNAWLTHGAYDTSFDPTTSLLLPFCPSKKYTARPQYTHSTDHVSIVHHSTIHYSITRARRNNNRWQPTTPAHVCICLWWFPFVVIMRMHAALPPRTIVGDIRWCPM